MNMIYVYVVTCAIYIDLNVMVSMQTVNGPTITEIVYVRNLN